MTLAKSSILVAISYIIKIASALLINKLLAVYIGASGIAMIAQFRSFVQMLTTLSTGGINSGIVKLIAQNKENIDIKNEVKNISLSIAIIFSSLCMLFSIFFSESIAIYLFTEVKYTIFIQVFSVSIILFSFNQIFLFFINGEGDTKLFTIISIYQSLIILILSFIFVYFYKLEGALLVVSISQVIISFISFYYVLKKRIFKLKTFSFSINNEYTKTLFSYTAITFVNALSVAISLILIRNILIDRFGIEQTGYWQAVWNISEVYLGFITMLLSVYFYPKISSLLQEKEKLKIEIKMIVLFVTLLSLLTISVTYMLKEFIVTILYTDEFIESVIFFKYLLIGDFFKILSWIFGYYMLSMMATKAIIISTIISSILFVSLTHLFTLHYGIEGVNYAYVIVYVSYLIFTVVYTRRNIYER